MHVGASERESGQLQARVASSPQSPRHSPCATSTVLDPGGVNLFNSVALRPPGAHDAPTHPMHATGRGGARRPTRGVHSLHLQRLPRPLSNTVLNVSERGASLCLLLGRRAAASVFFLNKKKHARFVARTFFRSLRELVWPGRLFCFFKKHNKQHSATQGYNTHRASPLRPDVT